MARGFSYRDNIEQDFHSNYPDHPDAEVYYRLLVCLAAMAAMWLWLFFK